MAKKAVFLGAVGAFEIYKAGHVVIVNENGAFAFNLRAADNGFRDPVAHCAAIVKAEAERAEERAAAAVEAKAARLARVERQRAARAARKAEQPEFAF